MKVYENPELVIEVLEITDVITTSVCVDDNATNCPNESDLM